MIIGLSEISFPVYRIGPIKGIFEDGAFFAEYKDKASDTVTRHYVDDKSIDKPSLAQRRLAMMGEGRKLLKLDKATFFLGDFIKLATPSVWFIDSNGTIFQYRKQKRVRLTYRKITNIIDLNSGGTLVEVQGVPNRFKILYKPTTAVEYAGVLMVGTGFILYGLYDKLYDDSYRMI